MIIVFISEAGLWINDVHWYFDCWYQAGRTVSIRVCAEDTPGRFRIETMKYT